MSAPPEYLPHRTETQRLGDDIATAMRNLRRDWPHMLRPGDTQAPGRATNAGILLDDHSQSGQDTNRITRTLSLRRYVQDVLAAHCGLIIDERPVRDPSTHPLGTDVPAMATFLERHSEWISGHDSGEAVKDEVTELAHMCHLVAFPKRRESISIGRCPLEIPGEADVLEVCGGDVRSRTSDGERDGEAWAACSKCGEVAVATWWEDKMFDDPEIRRWLTDADVVTFMHSTYGEVIQQGTVRQWVKRGVLQPSGHATDDGRRLFARDAVVYAIDLHKRRQAVPG